jgi:glycosyltransferase involved in cell wall biosynthesis
LKRRLIVGSNNKDSDKFVGLAATILIPTHDHGPTLHYAIRSVLNQTVQDFELFVIGDGVTPEARAIIQEYAAKDSRVRFFDHPKGPRHGEIYRHQALREARGEIVCYLSDDDMWLPGHVAYMRELLGDADFAHVLPLAITVTGKVDLRSGTFDRAECQEAVRAGKNFVPLSAAGHTLAVYRRLPFGWRTTPEGINTDSYMWQQILNVPGRRSRSGLRPTLLNFPSPARKEWPAARRLGELKEWENKMRDPNLEQALMGSALDYLISHRVSRESHIAYLEIEDRELREIIHVMESDITWRTRKAILNLPVLGPVVKKVARAVFGRGSR